ncbi:hypothetical protein PLICRDRAFT_682358 [Plicaturopsis crispa FD-325 SS-3]|nr:hypothetical protein PLICRDRAFT_682358 [Plicaturopsis crispa FD-325 SS-3]
MPSPSESDVEAEQRHFANVIETFNSYQKYSLAANNRRRKDVYTLPKDDHELLESLGYKQKLAEVDEAIMANAQFLKQIVANPEIFGHDLGDATAEGDAEGISEERGTAQENAHASHSHDHISSGHSHSHTTSHSHSHSHSHGESSASSKGRRYRPTDFDMDKVRSTLKQFVRDWSREGIEEREACYKPMEDALLQHFSDIPFEERGNFRVLVPGAGLGRLAYDVASLGFACQGNEFSHHMLLSSYFILNRTDEIDKYKIYPYAHSFSNVPSREAMLRPISIPDVLPSALPPGSDFSLIYGAEEGDGSEHEPQAGQWDAILTCFFIDTAKNIVNYLRILHRILAPGGVWINLGPLLWHFENNTTNDPSIELDLEEVKVLARKIGFEISNERTIDTTYTSNSAAMLGYVYHAAFWTATKIP